MDTGPRIDSYEWAGGREAMLRWGTEDSPTVVLALPLFEEANRTRATATRMLRFLAACGIAGALPDLPGTSDSLIDTIDARLPDWRAAFAAATAALPSPVHALAIRGGALVVTDARVVSTWLLSPQSGGDTLRELRRIKTLGDGLSFAGNELHPALLVALEKADPPTTPPLRVVRLDGDLRPADATVDFAAPWRTAEPAHDDALAQALSDDVATWIARCDG